MKIEVLVTTMFCKDFEALYRKMNMKGSAVIGNQCEENGHEKLLINGNTVDCVSSDKRGVSLNRNTTIANSSGDILVTGDDDITYYDNYEEIIQSAFMQFPKADIIMFDLVSDCVERPVFSLPKSKFLNFREFVMFGTVQMAYRRSVIDGGIRYNEMFGPGSSYFGDNCGEDTLFFVDAHKNKHKIAYCKQSIGVVSQAESTWFEKRWSSLFFQGQGALFTAMSRTLSIPYILYYAFVKHSSYRREVSLFKAVAEMLRGKRRYLKEIANY